MSRNNVNAPKPDFDGAAVGRKDTVIANDRELLQALGLNDAQTAMYVGRSRQALNNQLGAQRDGMARVATFKPSELLFLVLAARRNGIAFDEGAVLDYIELTRSVRKGPAGKAYELLSQTLLGSEDVDVKEASAIVMILPDFIELRASCVDAVDRLRDVVEEVREANPDCAIVVISSSRVKAQAALASFGLEEKRGEVEPVGHELADYYMPLVLIYGRGEFLKGNPRPYMLTRVGTLIGALQYRAPMMSECVRVMLPEALQQEIFSERAAPERQR